jgi:hypothetical protein
MHMSNWIACFGFANEEMNSRLPQSREKNGIQASGQGNFRQCVFKAKTAAQKIIAAPKWRLQWRIGLSYMNFKRKLTENLSAGQTSRTPSPAIETGCHKMAKASLESDERCYGVTIYFNVRDYTVSFEHFSFGIIGNTIFHSHFIVVALNNQSGIAIEDLGDICLSSIQKDLNA